MLLLLLLLPVLAVSSNPFHKYPYVFLLDVGNEELEKVDTKQIRISTPGGSVALRHPAIGNGDDIAHVRVSGIDFGTDLKANIVDGGPGFKYVVIVLMGNPGVTFDAVITIQTVKSNDNDSIQPLEDDFNNDGSIKYSSYEVSKDDPNDSAEDLSEGEEGVEASQDGVKKSNEELIQESSNTYEALSGFGREYDINEDNDMNDSNNPVVKTNLYESDNENIAHEKSRNVEVEEYDFSEGNTRIDSPVADSSLTNDNYRQYENQPSFNDKYETIKSQKVYDVEEDQARAPAYQNYDDRQDINEVNDYYDEDYPGKYDANNNNFIDNDDSSAVPY